MNKKLVRAVATAAGRLGYHIVQDWRIQHYPTARFLSRFFDFLEVDCVIDVGANQGQYHDFLREEVGYQGLIVSFEPIPRHVELLKSRSATEPAWQIEDCALGATPGTAMFNVMAESEFSSFLQPDHSAVEMFREMNAVSERVEVSVRTLDQVLPEIETRYGERNVYLKLDTQGFDLEVMKGAPASRARIRGLQTEASVQPLYRSMPDFATAIRALQEIGFEPSGFFPNNEGHFPRLVEFDCFMIARRLLPSTVH